MDEKRGALERAEFEELTRPLIKWLAQNQHPHTRVIVDSVHAELSEGMMTLYTEEYLIG